MTLKTSNIALNNVMEKWPLMAQNHGLTPLEKCQYFDALNFFFVLAIKSVLFFLGHHRTHFPSLYCQKIKGGKMAVFGPKQWTNPFGKMTIFRFFDLLIFIA